MSKGFTLIELLLVVVIIGIVAALVLPKFGDVKDRAYVAAMQNDLRNLATQQEIYFDSNGEYFEGTDVESIPGYATSQNVSIEVERNDADAGYIATATHGLVSDNQSCTLEIGLTALNRVAC